MIYFDRANFIMEFMRLLGRILGLSIPSIALINGHAIAGGFFLSMAHDWRVSRSEKGKINFALNEVKIGIFYLRYINRNVFTSWIECCRIIKIKPLNL